MRMLKMKNDTDLLCAFMLNTDNEFVFLYEFPNGCYSLAFWDGMQQRDVTSTVTH